MKQPETAGELREYLFSLTLHGIKLGLSNIRQLLDAAGNPQQQYPTVHVAGTNGKGSVLAMLDAMLSAAGYRTARFTSPHLIDLRERFLIGSEPVSEEMLLENIAFFRDAATVMDPPPTFFEMCTAIALRAFSKAGIDVALIETGMGGRLDSTNVIQPLAAAITSVGLDHTRYLGETLEEIAREKAGILKPGIPAVIGEIQEPSLPVILQRAHTLESPVLRSGAEYTFSINGAPWEERFAFEGNGIHMEEVPLALAGRHQGANAGVAVALASLLRNRFPRLDGQAIRAGLASAVWPCRLERFGSNPPVIIDVAHNVDGMEKLSRVPGPYVVVMSVSDDKDAAGMIRLLRPTARCLILTCFSGKRAMPLDCLCEAAGDTEFETIPTLEAALESGLERARREGLSLLITGSIYTAGEARQLLIDKHGAPPLRF